MYSLICARSFLELRPDIADREEHLEMHNKDIRSPLTTSKRVGSGEVTGCHCSPFIS